MNATETIPTGALEHLKQMAAVYGYQLTPALAPVIELNPGIARMQTLIKKKEWTNTDAVQAVNYCKAAGIGDKIAGLFDYVKPNQCY